LSLFEGNADGQSLVKMFHQQPKVSAEVRATQIAKVVRHFYGEGIQLS
jgi:hypothetical protein